MTSGNFEIKDAFYLNNEAIKIISGGMHYFRIVPEYWRDRLLKLKNLGCNTVETYVPWNMHEPVGLTNGVNSFEELGQYFAGIKANYPDVIPWDASASEQSFGQQLSAGYFQSNTKTLFMDGLDVPIFFGTSAEDMFTLASPYMEGDEYVAFAKQMKEWADAGYWREDVLNYTGDTREEFYAAQTGADQHHTQTYYTGVRPMMDEKQPGSDVKFFSFSEPSKNLMNLVITHGALSVGANSQHPERALMVYDLLRNDPEIYRLYNYGIEGVQYIVTEEGKLDRPESYKADEPNMKLETNFWCGYYSQPNSG